VPEAPEAEAEAVRVEAEAEALENGPLPHHWEDRKVKFYTKFQNNPSTNGMSRNILKQYADGPST
jgi:hypothetical protein